MQVKSTYPFLLRYLIRDSENRMVPYKAILMDVKEPSRTADQVRACKCERLIPWLNSSATHIPNPWLILVQMLELEV